VHGTGGILSLPDANAFTGDVVVTRSRGEVETVQYDLRGAHETRGMGVEELALALAEGRPHRANAELALHVLEAAEAIADSAKGQRFIELRAPSVGGRH
jgi:predicted dehydrogenase